MTMFFDREPFGEEASFSMLSLTNYFNYSCAPNVRVLSIGSKAKFITMRPINKGEQLFIAFWPSHLELPLEDRQRYLKKDRRYVCKCEACEEPQKYPLLNNLEIKDRRAYCHSPESQRDLNEIIQKLDVGAAVQLFRLACNYLDAHAEVYPSLESNRL
jgi:hypothetical protein